MPDDLLVKAIARSIAAGKIVGWFQGGAEFGPRALGHRSILADPRNPRIKGILNRTIKHREWFRPYAPSIMQEHLDEFFLGVHPSPFMSFALPVRPQKKRLIPGVVHCDGTARVQTVNARDNGIYYRLIEAFYRITGIPMLLNTSFNTKGVPIVETPRDAVSVFLGSGLDILVMGTTVIEAKPR